MDKKTVLIGEYHPWEGKVRIGCHHYARLFLQHGWRVGYISHPVSPFHIVRVDNKLRFKNWISGGIFTGGLFSYVPFTLLPYLNVPVLDSLYVGCKSLKLCVPPLKKILREHQIEKVKLLFVSDPLLGGLADIVLYEYFIFRIADEMTAFSSSPSSMRQLVQRYIVKADFVFATSKYLCEELRHFRKDVAYLPNGCEYDHFATPSENQPSEYNNIPCPRVIYVGAVADWFDIKLISQCAARLKDISFILIGPVSCNVNKLYAHKNVYLLGPRSYSELPAYMQHTDVGIIPFVKTELTDKVSPIKLFEYCAAGIPVVMTDLKEAGLYANQDFVLKAKTNDEFTEFIQSAIVRRHELKEKCKAFARNNSWSKRFEVIMDFLERKKL